MDAGFLTESNAEIANTEIARSGESDTKTADQTVDVDQLAKLAANGDRLAFSELITLEYDFMFRVAFKWAGNQADAEDVAQDVCVKLPRILKSFEGRAKFETWLYRIVVNAVRDRQRKTVRRSEVFDEHLEVRPSTAATDANLERDAIWDAVRQLPPRQADAVLLVYAEEKNHAEAAQILGCKESTVSWHIHEAKKALKALL